MEYRDYYKILGVPRTASDKEIKAAYRRLARKYHPDVNPNDKAAEERFKEINEAYTVLTDPQKRARYDQVGSGGGFPGFDWEQQRRTRPNGGRGGVRVEFGRGGGGGFSDFFEALFGQGFDFGAGPAPHMRSRAGSDLEQPIEVSLEEVLNGSRRLIATQVPDTCPTCHGSGLTNRRACPTCQGSGSVMRDRRIEVKIPPGVRDGSRIRLAGEGGQGVGGGPRGDLYLVVSVQDHPHYECKGSDIYCDIPVPLTTAMLGGGGGRARTEG